MAENQDIERTEEFRKAKRNLLWSASAAILACFASRETGATQPLLGFHIAPVWIALALWFATIYFLFPFRHQFAKIELINSGLKGRDSKDLEKRANDQIERLKSAADGLADADRAIEIFSRYAARLDAGEEVESLHPAQIAELENGLALRTGAVAVSEELIPALRNWMTEELRALDGVPVGHGLPQAQSDLRDDLPGIIAPMLSEGAQRAANELLRSQINVKVHDFTEVMNSHLGSYERAKAVLDAIPTLDPDIGLLKLRDHFASSERSIFKWYDKWIPHCLTLAALLLVPLTYGYTIVEIVADYRTELPWRVQRAEPVSAD